MRILYLGQPLTKYICLLALTEMVQSSAYNWAPPSDYRQSCTESPKSRTQTYGYFRTGGRRCQKGDPKTRLCKKIHNVGDLELLKFAKDQDSQVLGIRHSSSSTSDGTAVAGPKRNIEATEINLPMTLLHLHMRDNSTLARGIMEMQPPRRH